MKKDITVLNSSQLPHFLLSAESIKVFINFCYSAGYYFESIYDN